MPLAIVYYALNEFYPDLKFNLKHTQRLVFRYYA